MKKQSSILLNIQIFIQLKIFVIIFSIQKKYFFNSKNLFFLTRKYKMVIQSYSY